MKSILYTHMQIIYFILFIDVKRAILLSQMKKLETQNKILQEENERLKSTNKLENRDIKQDEERQPSTFKSFSK